MFVCGHVLKCWHSTLTPLLPPCISVFSFSRLPHSLFEAPRLHANKRRCVCTERPLIGQSWLSCLNRGSVGDEELPWSPNISISLISSLRAAPAVRVGNSQVCVTRVCRAAPATSTHSYVWIVHCVEKYCSKTIYFAICNRWSDPLQVR